MRPGARALFACASCAAFLVVGAAGLGCGKKADDKADPQGSGSAPAVEPDRYVGALSLDGKPLEITRCRPGHNESQAIHLDLVTTAGVLRFVPYVPQMRWNPKPDSTEPGAPIECTDLQRSWGGGNRPDGTTYFRGRLIFYCKFGTSVIAGDVNVDCGNITPLERKLLDENQKKNRDKVSTPPPR